LNISQNYKNLERQVVKVEGLGKRPKEAKEKDPISETRWCRRLTNGTIEDTINDFILL